MKVIYCRFFFFFLSIKVVAVAFPLTSMFVELENHLTCPNLPSPLETCTVGRLIWIALKGPTQVLACVSSQVAILLFQTNLAVLPHAI